MKNLILILFFCIVQAAHCFSQGEGAKSYNIHLSALLEQRKTNLSDKPFIIALNSVISFINTGADSLLFNKDVPKEQKSIYYELFFLTNLPKNYSHYHILSVDSVDNGYRFKIITRQQIEEYKSDEILAIANVQVINGLIDISYKNNLKEFNTIKMDQITYFTKDKQSFNSTEACKAVNFCDSIKKVLGLKKLHPLNYVLSKKGKAPEVFGFDYFWSPFGLFMYNDLLLSNGIGENYRHELAHYILQDYKLNKQASEGLAVWFGGSQNASFKSYISKWFIENGIPSKEQIQDVFENTKPGKNRKYLYVLSSISIDIIYDKQGTKGIVQLLNNSDKYYNMNLLEILKDISGENKENLIDQIYNKCKII